MLKFEKYQGYKFIPQPNFIVCNCPNFAVYKTLGLGAKEKNETTTFGFAKVRKNIWMMHKSPSIIIFISGSGWIYVNNHTNGKNFIHLRERRRVFGSLHGKI